MTRFLRIVLSFSGFTPSCRLAHELAVAGHAERLPPVLRRSLRSEYRHGVFQRFNSFGEGFQGQFSHGTLLSFGKSTISCDRDDGYAAGSRRSRNALAMTSKLVPMSAAMAIQR